MKNRSYGITGRYGIIGLLVLLPFLFTGCGPEEKEQAKEIVIPVKTARVTGNDISIPVHTSGRLYPKSMVKLSFKVGGIIEQLYVEEGDTVKKGSLLATLNPAEIKALHSQAKDGRQKAERDLKRVRNLYKDRAATLEQMQNAETAFQVAESNLTIASFNLTHSRIKAPAGGKILKRLSEKGEITAAGTPIFIFGSTDNAWVVKAGVSERDIVRIARNDSAVVRFDAYPGKEFKAVVSEVADSIDPAAGTFEVELSVENEGKKFAAGFVGRVGIEPSAVERFFIIPVDSVVEGEGSDGVVFTVKDNKAQKLNIKVAHIFPTKIAVSAGLENIDVVVTSGAAYLNDGSQVKVTRQ
ncbi:MAG: efflux RND transporter periplasmic adaptor subunit [bacterium]|nr:efflux RND transporter periplasmic adaptor subunit [bacterium]